MPNRIIKESINESRGLASCSFFAQDLYKRLITYADDYGRFNADPQIMIARLYPRELTVVSLEELNGGLIELAGVGKIGFYTSKPRREIYGAFPNWGEHQRVRESKRCYPEATDTTVNDWYMRRFVPMEMKIAIIERDKFKCSICGKHVAETDDARMLVKMGAGLFHIDHVVPCQQGGRATLENLRLTCPRCNMTRKKTFSYDEILSFAFCGENEKNNGSCGVGEKVAASCGELRREDESCGSRVRPRAGAESNPIQYESESNPSTSPEPCETARGLVDEKPVFEIILNDKTYYPVTQSKIDKYRELYPAVNVEQEFRNMIGWCESSPRNRKTKSGVEKFINGWLARNQNSGGKTAQTQKQTVDFGAILKGGQ